MAADIAFSLAGTILEKIGSFTFQEICMAWGMKDDLDKLRLTTFILRDKLLHAKKRQEPSDALNQCLIRLKGAFDDAVDVLDEFECEVLRRQVVKEYGCVDRKVRRFFSWSNPLVFRFSLAQQIREIRQRLDDIVKEMAKFQLINIQLNPNHHDLMEGTRDMTHSLVDPSEVIGRDDDKKKVIDMFEMQDQDNSDKNFSVIPIVGIGGLGKTTVAKLVFNDGKVVKRFKLRLWVCVSSDFDVHRVVREILKSAGLAGQDPRNYSTDLLRRSLRNTLEGKKFLLVLDDVWNEDRNKWIELRDFLTGGAEGSKVIVTTRSLEVASIMSQTRPHELEGLSEEDSLSLFFKYAFGDKKLADQHPQLKDIGKEIVKKCDGVPLALKTIGSLLYSKDDFVWKFIRDNEIWKLKKEDAHILPALRLSYDSLSPSLKQCFAYCSTFPVAMDMANFELIWIWMALGIIQSPNDKMELEDIGESNFRELCAKCFFQVVEIEGPFCECKMHDSIHELASSIIEYECSIMKTGCKKVPETVRHLRIFLDENNLKTLQNLNRVRSIYIGGTTADDIVIKSFLASISRFRYLRVFDLNSLSFDVLPSSIGTLKHLRYLNLSNNVEIKKLPDSICNLQSLESLLLSGCVELEILPRDIRKLVSLRHLYVTTKQACLPENGVGSLKSLRFLGIRGCENLKSLPSDLLCCTTLRALVIGKCEQLDLANGSISNKSAQLSLQIFVIWELQKTTALPQWLYSASNTLRHLVIGSCYNLATLPDWLRNLTSLQKLEICRCNALSSLPEGMLQLTSLKYLKIEDCKQLDLASGGNGVAQLNLQTLVILGLPKTTALPQWLYGAAITLQHLMIGRCHNLAKLPGWLSSLTSLQKLQIWYCQALSSLPEGMQQLKSLTELYIGGCYELQKKCKSDTGADWAKIAHVPNLHVDDDDVDKIMEPPWKAYDLLKF